ncbi:MAG: winged helix-turn-helix domain-containing protein [Candidatus Peregrinibacteria bacterium]
MTGLPASIEAYLTEAGFAATELLILRKLLEEDALTLREIAAKTGKSTGVLDQSLKKLLKRNIVIREIINDAPKYLVKSLEAIVSWMKRDMAEKRELLKRKEQDFESFVASLKRDATRPEMEYFEGEEGMQKAYMKLLDVVNDGLLLQYVPVRCREEEDPLRVFRVQHFRQRHKRKIFSRIIAEDTLLGRRFRSRDPFEYRETVLLPEGHFPFAFEKILAGRTVACFNHDEMRACFIHYPELAKMERAVFEREWRAIKDQRHISSTEMPDTGSSVNLRTRMVSLREFFVGRKSLVVFVVCALLAGWVTYGFYRHNYNLTLQRTREKGMAIAATAAPEFDAKDLPEFHSW